MACARPVEAWISESGGLTFSRAKARGPSFLMACRQCMPCRVAKKQELAIRLLHESKMHDDNSFVTLTFDDAHLPEHGSVSKRDLQLFMMRVRKHCGSGIRFFGCGEYGELGLRPHYHVLLFNLSFNDRVLWREAKSGANSYRSATLEKLWPFGSSEVSDVTAKSCSYVAGYVTKKITGKLADTHYAVVDAYGEVHHRAPEFSTQSMRPGIGASFFDKYHPEIIDNDCCIVNGKPVPAPGYYLRRYRKHHAVDADWRAHERGLKGQDLAERTAADRTPERLEVREQVLKLNMARFSKPLD